MIGCPEIFSPSVPDFSSLCFISRSNNYVAFVEFAVFQSAGKIMKRKRSIVDDTIEIVDSSATRVLPTEMLSHIFTFLPLVDRKSVKLTCRLWYDCCDSVHIRKREKFVFQTHPGAEHVAEVLMRRSKYSLLDLEFQSLPVSMLAANVWKACGHGIRTLELHMCKYDDETIGNIIFYCENLTSLVLTEEEGEGNLKLIPIAYSPRLLDDLIEKGIRRPKLHTLSVFIKYDDHENVLHKIFLLYPCIKHLNLRMISHSSEFCDPYPMRLNKCLSPDTQLESLTVKILTPEGWMGVLVDQTEQQGLRLKYLETWLMYNRMSQNLCKFFTSHRNLEVIKLWTCHAPENLFYNILENCPNLREFHLKFHWSSKIVLTPSEVSRFIASISKLESLVLSFRLEDGGQVPSFCDLLPDTVQLNLISLDWRSPSGSTDFCAAFLQRCPSLKHLRLQACCESTLQTIFKYLPELQTLILNGIHDCFDFGLTGCSVDGIKEGYTIKRLQQLRHLELSDFNISTMERTLLFELQLPHLEFLSLEGIGWYNRVSDEALNHFASHLPELRVLAINPPSIDDNYSYSKILQLCKRLNNLHRLILDIPDDEDLFIEDMVDEETVQSIFSTCPSLRYISDYADTTFMRDPFTGKVLFKRRLKFPKNIFEEQMCLFSLDNAYFDDWD